MRFLELKIPPPVVALILALLMWGLSRGLPTPDADPVVRLSMALLLAITGAYFDLSGLYAFRRARTTINPLKPSATSALVQSGVYRITRNPMYLGMACLLGGWTAYLWSPWALLGPVLFIAYITRFQITPEERTMAAKFGDEFEAYRRRVRRWI